LSESKKIPAEVAGNVLQTRRTKEMIKIPTRVLVVDDEKDFVEMLSLRLQEMGERVTPAYRGKECLEILERQEIDVVILDIKMPGMDGIETLKEIKKKFPLVEVIMLTGHGTTETAVEGMKLGAFDYLLKPADFDDLTEKLTGARERKDEQEERIRKAEARSLLRRGGNLF
jgi:DNA-binding NtrC family response regulator